MRKNINIIMIAQFIYPYLTGGAEIHSYYVSKELSKGNVVHLLSNSKYPIKFSGSSNNLNIKPIPFRFFSSAFFILYGLILLLLKSRYADIIHVQTALSPIILGVLLKVFLNKPFFITCHGSEVRLQKNRIFKFIQKFSFTLADGLIAVSIDIKNVLTSKYAVSPSKIRLIPNGFEEEMINHLKDSTSTSHPFHLAFVGSLRPFKDPFVLINSFKEIAKKYPDAFLNIVGDGPLRPKLEKFCNENELSSKVFFWGIVPHEKALKIIAESEIFILVSKEEGLPTVLIEAMALSKAVIATSVGGVPEVVKNEVNGILITPRSINQTICAIQDLLSNSDLKKKLGEAAVETVKNLTWTKIAEKYEETYLKVINERDLVTNG